MSAVRRVFLLSPAKAGGQRSQMLARPGARFELARQVQIGDATLGDVFAFCSGLYFRGKLTYARKFARSAEAVQVITPTRGLVQADTLVGVEDLQEFARVDVDAAEPRFSEPLQASAQLLAGAKEVVLLGSIATGKYVETLLPVFGERLLFPKEFVGRGDMSRGGLLLRRAAAGEELEYIPVAGAIRTGRRAVRISAMRSRPAVT